MCSITSTDEMFVHIRTASSEVAAAVTTAVQLGLVEAVAEAGSGSKSNIGIHMQNQIY